MPAIGCAIVTLEGDQIHSCLVKGVNDYDRSTVVPYVQVCGSVVRGDQPGDLYNSQGKMPMNEKEAAGEEQWFSGSFSLFKE
ncbi:hypothetical protein [Laceyella putida]|uniref:Uncharacterized protein n=1 Tax=Laceyella putida TaxID=110101 RepID=A0ABW2RPI3_9BACL